MSSKIEYWKGLIKTGLDNRAREQGKYETLMTRLRDDYGLESVDGLEKLIADEQEKLAANKLLLEKLEEEFRNEYEAKLVEAAR